MFVGVCFASIWHLVPTSLGLRLIKRSLLFVYEVATNKKAKALSNPSLQAERDPEGKQVFLRLQRRARRGLLGVKFVSSLWVRNCGKRWKLLKLKGIEDTRSSRDVGMRGGTDRCSSYPRPDFPLFISLHSCGYA